MRTSKRQCGKRLSRRLCDVMSRRAPAVEADTPLSEAARRMRALSVTRLPVCNGPKLVGLITARDLTMRATAEGLDPLTSAVRDVMSRKVPSIEQDRDIQQAFDLMQGCNLFQLFVVDRQQHLVGTVNFRDLRCARRMSRPIRSG